MKHYCTPCNSMQVTLNVIKLYLLENFGTSLGNFISFLILVLCVGISVYLSIQTPRRNLPPGPRGFPFFGYLPLLGKEPHKTLTELAKKYGNIYGLYLGRNYTVFLTEYNVAKETLSHPLALDRPEGIFDVLPGSGGISGMNGEEWRDQRRFCMHSMRDLGLGKRPWERVIQEEVQDFVHQISAQNGAPFDFSHELTTSVNCNIMSLLIGRRMERELEKDDVQVVTVFPKICMEYIGHSDVTTSFPSLRKYLELFKVSGYHENATITSKFINFVRKEIKRHQASAELKDATDFINLYLKQATKFMDKVDHFYSERNLEGTLTVLLLGAGDTVVSALKWLFFLMAAYPEIQDKVYAELDDIIDKEGRPSYENRSKFLYTFAVMMEALRFSSIVPLNNTRCAHEDFTVKGYTIPKGAHIVVVHWALHNDPNFWEHPEKFDPDRFLSSDKKQHLKLDSFIPFSFGRRNCPGETVGWMELFLYFATIIHRFKVTKPEGENLDFDIDYGLVCHLKPKKLCFVPRD